MKAVDNLAGGPPEMRAYVDGRTNDILAGLGKDPTVDDLRRMASRLTTAAHEAGHATLIAASASIPRCVEIGRERAVERQAHLAGEHIELWIGATRFARGCILAGDINVFAQPEIFVTSMIGTLGGILGEQLVDAHHPLSATDELGVFLGGCETLDALCAAAHGTHALALSMAGMDCLHINRHVFDRIRHALTRTKRLDSKRLRVLCRDIVPVDLPTMASANIESLATSAPPGFTT